MKTALQILILIFFIQSCKSQEKDLNINYENIKVSIPGNPGPWLIHNENFYCYFSTDNDKFSSGSKSHFYIINKNGKTKAKIEVPKELQTFYYDLYVKNDSIFTTEYYNQNTYFLDEGKDEWIKTKKGIDLFYKDESYEIFSKDFGEWGGVTWFKDKKTKKQFEFAASSPIINYLNKNYYVTLNNKILEISNPQTLQVSKDPYDYEKAVLKENYFRNGSNSLKGTKTIFEYKNNDYFNAKFSIATSFVANNKLYNIYSDSLSCKIGIIVNGKLIPQYEFEEKIKPFTWNYDWRNPISDKQFQTIQFVNEKTKHFGIIEINNNNVTVFNFVNSFKEPIFGELKMQETIEKTVNYYIDNFANLNLTQVDSLEQNVEANDITQNHKIGHYLLDGRDVATPRIYRKFETSLIKVLSQYYYTNKDKRIELIEIEWKTKSNFQSQEEAIEESKFDPTKIYQSKFNQLSNFLKNKIGNPTKTIEDKNGSRLQWNTVDKTIELYYDNNLVEFRILRK